MPTTCEFEFFENPAKVYYSGQFLSGHLTLNIDSPKTVRGIYILIEGMGYCHWTTGSGKNEKSHTGEEIYLREKKYFVGSENDDITVQTGVYDYDFQIQLSPQLPTSLEADIGYIRYTVTLKLDRQMWPDQVFETTFTVIKPLDLNENPVYRLPVEGEKRKTFYLCCLFCWCQSQPLVIHARLPVGGYTPGQTMNLDFTADNGSDQDVLDFSAQLIKKIEYRTRANSSKRTEEVIVITEKKTDGCLQTKSNSYRVNLEVSPVPPTDFTTSNVCKVHYFVRIIGAVSGCHNNAILELPITIGTYPILDNFRINPSRPFGGESFAQQPSAPDLVDKSPVYQPQEPPSYEEAVQTGGNFKPKYPVFRRATSYSSNN